MITHQPRSTLFPYTTLFRSFPNINLTDSGSNEPASHGFIQYKIKLQTGVPAGTQIQNTAYIYFEFACLLVRSEEHTSELQSLTNLVCRLLLEKKKKKK